MTLHRHDIPAPLMARPSADVLSRKQQFQGVTVSACIDARQHLITKNRNGQNENCTPIETSHAAHKGHDQPHNDSQVNYSRPLQTPIFNNNEAAPDVDLSLDALKQLRRLSVSREEGGADPDINITATNLDPEALSKLLWVPANVHPEIYPNEWKSYVKKQAEYSAFSGAGVLRPSSNLRRRRSLLAADSHVTLEKTANGVTSSNESGYTIQTRLAPESDSYDPNDFGIKLADLENWNQFSKDPQKMGLLRKLSIQFTPSDASQLTLGESEGDDEDAVVLAPYNAQKLKRSSHTTVRRKDRNNGSFTVISRQHSMHKERGYSAESAALKDSQNLEEQYSLQQSSPKPQAQKQQPSNNNNYRGVSDCLYGRSLQERLKSKPVEQNYQYADAENLPDLPIPTIRKATSKPELKEKVKLNLRLPASKASNPQKRSNENRSPSLGSIGPYAHTECGNEHIRRVNSMSSLSDKKKPSEKSSMQYKLKKGLTKIFSSEQSSNTLGIKGNKSTNYSGSGFFGRKKSLSNLSGAQQQHKKQPLRNGRQQLQDQQRQQQYHPNDLLQSSKLHCNRKGVQAKEIEPSFSRHGRQPLRETKLPLQAEQKLQGSLSDERSADGQGSYRLQNSENERSAELDLKRQPQSDLSQNYYHRYPIHIERAIFRFAHIKLANPRRPLLQQVLLSNFMYCYLDMIHKTQMMAMQYYDYDYVPEYEDAVEADDAAYDDQQAPHKIDNYGYYPRKSNGQSVIDSIPKSAFSADNVRQELDQNLSSYFASKVEPKSRAQAAKTDGALESNANLHRNDRLR